MSCARDSYAPLHFAVSPELNQQFLLALADFNADYIGAVRGNKQAANHQTPASSVRYPIASPACAMIWTSVASKAPTIDQ